VTARSALLRLAPPATALALLASACTGGSDGSSGADSPSATTSGLSSSSSATPVVPPAPKAAACYRLSGPQLTRPTNASKAVPCTSRHTARTIFVGRLRTVVDGHALSVASDRVQRQLATTCTRKLAAYVGGSAKSRDLSRFNVVWYSPTLDQADRGASWFRCDLIAFADAEKLYALPGARRLKGALDRPTGLDTYGLCGTAAPGAPGFQRMICAKPHAWRAFDTVGLAGKRYPGEAKVRTAGDAVCKGRAKARAGNALKFEYGWEWPSREQWLGGQHFGYCWAPQG
jgi:hypothetical protein